MSVEHRLTRVRKAFRRNMPGLRRHLIFLLGGLFPDDEVSSHYVRPALLRATGVTVGRRLWLGGRIRLNNSNLTIGDYVSIGPECLFDVLSDITIESRVSIGYGVTLITGHHDIGPESRRLGRLVGRPITVKTGAWIGSKATILPGVTIGAGAVVSAGSVVGRDVKANTLVAGVPARMIRVLPSGADGVCAGDRPAMTRQ